MPRTIPDLMKAQADADAAQANLQTIQNQRDLLAEYLYSVYQQQIVGGGGLQAELQTILRMLLNEGVPRATIEGILRQNSVPITGLPW